LQRLYSTFARGWPGVGLLCLRLVGAAGAFHYVLASGKLSLKNVVECAAGLLLCAGLWTPVAGAVLAALAVWSAVSANGDPWPHVLLAAMASALALLGPGTWSIDASLFGRKRLIREP
jgi:putative oxidoreductase